MSSEPILLGGLFSESGAIADIEASMRRGTELAVAEVNAQGGVNGRPFELRLCNPESKVPLYASYAESLIVEQKVQFLLGCYMSRMRKMVMPVVERYNALLFYPVFYEGFEYSDNIIYTGSTSHLNNVPLASYMFERFGKRVLMVGTDYIYPYESNRVMSDLIYEAGGEKLGEYYVPLDATREDYRKLMQQVVADRPSFIFCTVVGDGLRHLYDLYWELGLKPEELPIASLTTSETEIRSIGAEKVAGHITAASYFQSVDNPINRQAVANYKRMFGDDQVADMCWEAAYFQVHLLAMAMCKAGSQQVDDIRRILPTLEYPAPQGTIRVDGNNHHTYLHARIGRANAQGQFDILFETSQNVAPDPYLISPRPGGWVIRDRRGS
ncbi:transporter substrate-binding domain-containing protein [Pseudomonas lopnurensis]|uniref:transporter substrate-binding domain-containing protein n=1 Tax=Pseudomonas lopnurensis TaxID=1477517 RepID=UPI0028AFAEB5|nr:transporter substrate-binding domain-containing protein [Pseudomonas lopnurensis]